MRAEACEHDMEGAIRWLRGDDTLDVLRAVWKSTSELGSHAIELARGVGRRNSIPTHTGRLDPSSAQHHGRDVDDH